MYKDSYPRNIRLIPIASYPKSGNTWLRFVLANIISGHLKKNEQITFQNIYRWIPETRGIREIEPAVISSNLKIPIKTHAIPKIYKTLDKNILLIRHPGDVLASYHDYLSGVHNIKVPSVKDFVESSKYGLYQWVIMNEFWVKKGAFIARYENLRKNNEVEFLKICKFLEWPFDEDILYEALENSTKSKMNTVQKISGDPYNKTNYIFSRPDNSLNKIENRAIFKEACQQFANQHSLKHRIKALGYEL